MQGMMYRAILDALAITAECEIWFLKAPSSAVLVLHEVRLTQDDSETSLQLPIRLYKTATDQSAKGSAGTVNKLMTGLPTFPGTCRQYILTGATFATETTHLGEMSENALGGWYELPTPSGQIVLSPSEGFVVKLDATATLTMSGQMTIEVIGG